MQQGELTPVTLIPASDNITVHNFWLLI